VAGTVHVEPTGKRVARGETSAFSARRIGSPSAPSGAMNRRFRFPATTPCAAPAPTPSLPSPPIQWIALQPRARRPSPGRVAQRHNKFLAGRARIR